MQALPVAHIGILVANLERSRDRWSRVLGLPFSPITRYRPTNWSDLGNPEPHLHDARLTFFLGDNPSIEILEFVGNGTHSPIKGEGGHHLSFPPLDDNEARRRELSELGVGVDGEIRHDGRLIFMFADAGALNNVYTEWVEEHPDHPDVKDDLSPVNRLPDGSKTLFDVETILDLGGVRPASGITEIGVIVEALDDAVPRWTEITGYHFETSDRFALSDGSEPRIRLIERDDEAVRQGIAYAEFTVADLESVLSRLRADGLPLDEVSRGSDGQLCWLDVDPAYLNGFRVRFRQAHTD